MGSPTAVPVPWASTKVDVARIDPGVAAGVADEAGLGLRAGEGDAVGVAVLIHGRADDDAVDGIAVGDGGGEGFEKDHGGSFAADEAVGVGREGAAVAVG